MNEAETIKAIEKGLSDLLMMGKNLTLTGPAFLRIDMTDGVPINYGFMMEKKCCIPKGKSINNR